MEALADALVGRIPFHGRLPVALGAETSDGFAEAGRTR